MDVKAYGTRTMQKVLALHPRAEYTVHNFIYTWSARYIVTGLVFHVCHGALWRVGHLSGTPSPQGTTGFSFSALELWLINTILVLNI